MLFLHLFIVIVVLFVVIFRIVLVVFGLQGCHNIDRR